MKDIPVRKIHTAPDEPTSSDSFSIRDLKTLLDGEDIVQELHRHDYFYILALEKAAGAHKIDFTPYEVCDHCVFFMRPGQVHELLLKAETTGYLMVFKTEFYHPQGNVSNQPLRTASNKNLCLIEADRFKKMFAILTYIFHEYREKQNGYIDVIKANLGIFFIELLRQRRNSSNNLKNENTFLQERLERLSTLLDTHITTHKQVSQYADMLNLTPYQLNSMTKTTLGKTGSEIINEHIVLEAKRYLLATSNQVNQIAYHLGYEDVSYFIRFFKKHTGHSPETFRQNFK